jgi:hypothetical protein
MDNFKIIKVISELELYNNMKLVLAFTEGGNFKNCVTLLFYNENGEVNFIYGSRYDLQSDTNKDDFYYKEMFRLLLDEAFDNGERLFNNNGLPWKDVKIITEDDDFSLVVDGKYSSSSKEILFMCESMNNIIREWYTKSLPNKVEHRRRLIKIVLDE